MGGPLLAEWAAVLRAVVERVFGDYILRGREIRGPIAPRIQPHMRRTILLLSAAAWPFLATAQKPRAVIPIAQALRTLDSGDTVTVAGRATAGTGQLQSTVFDIAVEDS